MANVDSPHGLAVLRRRGGGPLETEVFKKLVGDGVAMCKGDVCRQAAGDATFGPVITSGLTTPGTTLATGIALNYSPASTAADIWVWTDWDAVFEMQDNNDTDGFTAANNGLNGNIECTASTGKTSAHELDESTIATSAARDVKCVALFAAIDNAYGSWARVECQWNQHRKGYGVAGV